MHIIPYKTRTTGSLSDFMPAIEGFNPEIYDRTFAFYDQFDTSVSSSNTIAEEVKTAPVETSVTLKSQKLIKELEKNYTFVNTEEIMEFLLQNSYLIGILFEAPSCIYKYFGFVPIHLELHCDPEEGWDELFIVIKSPFSSKEALEREDALVDNWFIHRMEDTKGNLNITEEPL